jgi:2-iminobutanoate/2-iminopropanoate deaminase
MSPPFHMITGTPDPVAPFSRTVEADGWVFVLYQTPFTTTDNDAPYPAGIEAEPHQVMHNARTVLQGCALDLSDVVSARVFLTRFDEDYAAMTTVYAGYFAPGRRPARTCFGVTPLAKGARVEIDLVARRRAAA